MENAWNPRTRWMTSHSGANKPFDPKGKYIPLYEVFPALYANGLEKKKKAYNEFIVVCKTTKRWKLVEPTDHVEFDAGFISLRSLLIHYDFLPENIICNN